MDNIFTRRVGNTFCKAHCLAVIIQYKALQYAFGTRFDSDRSVLGSTAFAINNSVLGSTVLGSTAPALTVIVQFQARQ